MPVGSWPPKSAGAAGAPPVDAEPPGPELEDELGEEDEDEDEGASRRSRRWRCGPEAARPPPRTRPEPRRGGAGGRRDRSSGCESVGGSGATSPSPPR